MKKGRGYISIAFVLLVAVGAANAQWHVVKTGMDFKKIAFSDSSNGFANARITDTAGYWWLDHDCIYKTEDGGRSWTMSLDLSGGFSYNIAYELHTRDTLVLSSMFNSDNIGGMQWGSISYSNNKGLSWDFLEITHYTNNCFYCGVALGENGDVWMADSRVWKWDPDTMTWDSLGCLIAYSWDIYSTSLWMLDSINGFSTVDLQGYFRKNLYITNSGGMTWDSISRHKWTDLFYPSSASKVYKIDSSSIYVSTDSGRTWQYQQGAPGVMTCIYGMDSLNIWAGGENGWVMRTKDGGAQWTSDALPTGATVLGLCLVSDTCGWAITGDSTLWGYGTAGTGVAGEPATEARSFKPGIRLYPNPGSGLRNIEFTLEKQGQVNVSIYDISGRCIKDVAGGAYQTGRHSIKWDGRDGKGAPVASGVYLCRVTGLGIELKAKALVVKSR